MTNNILICDDDRDIVSALKIYLESENYRTFAAYNGRDALAILEREEIHLVLLDVMMPVLDGVSTLSKLRESSNVPVILLTAKSEDTDKILGLNVGADDYVTKPFNSTPWSCWPGCALSCGAICSWAAARCGRTCSPSAASRWTTAARTSLWTESR